MIRFTPPQDFNDPFELRPSITHLTRCWLNHLRTATTENIHSYKNSFSEEDYDFSTERYNKREDYASLIDEQAKKHGILSLSASEEANPDISLYLGYEKDPRRNFLMWSHYSASHTGFSIEFSEKFMDAELTEVIYTDERPLLTFEEIEASSFPTFHYKSTSWRYENEWRLIKLLIESDSSPKAGIDLFKFTKEAVISVTFGCDASEKTKENVLKILRSDPAYSKVKTFFGSLNIEDFSLEFHQEIQKNGRIFTNDPEFSGHIIDIQKIPGNYS